MAGPDNQRFESMLRRELKGDASAARPDCPGPEQLAAFWERSLSRAERALVESHIGGCARCQSAMAAMARADSAADDRPAAAHAPGLWLRVAAPASVLAVVVIMISMHMFTAPTGSRREQIAMALRSRLHRRHVEPAPVLTPAPPPSETTGTQIAKSEPAPQPALVARAENKLKEAHPGPVPAAKTPEPALHPRELAMSDRPKPAENAQKEEQERGESSAEPSPASPMMQKAEPAAAVAGAPAPQAAAPEQVPAPASAQNPAAGESNAGTSAPSSAPGSSPAAQASVASNYQSSGPIAEEQASPSAPGTTEKPPLLKRWFGVGSENAVSEGQEQQQQSAAVSQGQMRPGAGNQQPAIGGAARSAAPDVQSAAQPGGLRHGLASFQSPPPVVAWNVGAGGLIQRLGQNGWETQQSGTSADLLSGAAPDAQVCWVAGREGTLLRTTDGGAHWQRIAPPSPSDLVKVEANGPDSATVTTAEGYRFSTTDGGQNWTGL